MYYIYSNETDDAFAVSHVSHGCIQSMNTKNGYTIDAYATMVWYGTCMAYV